MRRLTLSTLIVLLATACGADGHSGGSCHVTQNTDGTAKVSCDDGSTATISNGTNGKDGSNATSCAIPPATLTMQHEWSEAEMFRRDCWQDTITTFQNCQAGYDSCMKDRDLAEQNCQDVFARWVNSPSMRACGASIIKIVGKPGDVDFSTTVPDEDTDGDGISNWMEYNMGYNPCTPNTFGDCVKDSDLDYDADGIKNGADEYPICNPKDPAGWLSDCV
jgi:hypothetical protein